MRFPCEKALSTAALEPAEKLGKDFPVNNGQRTTCWRVPGRGETKQNLTTSNES